MLFNGLSTAANVYNCIFEKSKPEGGTFVKTANRIGELATKAFYTVNSIVNFKSRLKVKDYLAGLGHGLDIIISLLMKQSDIFISRGLSVGLYMFGNGVKDALQKYKFTSLAEHVKDIKQAVTKGLSYSKKDFWSNFKSSKTGLQSMIAGFFLVMGPIVWKLTGSRLLGASIRNFGATMQDVSQLKEDFILTKDEQQKPLIEKLKIASAKALGAKKAEENMRPLYYRSGLTYIVGTLSDWLSKLFNSMGYSQSLVRLFESSMTYLFDGLGVYLQGLAQDKEVGIKFNS